jgi:hypothetical protein
MLFAGAAAIPFATSSIASRAHAAVTGTPGGRATFNDVRDYGAVMDDPTAAAANLVALQAAVLAAVGASAQACSSGATTSPSATGIVYIPRGTLYVDVSGHNSVILANGVRVVGAGPAATRIQVKPDTPTDDLALFVVCAGHDAILEEITLRGPRDFTVRSMQAVNHSGASGSLRLVHVTIADFSCGVFINNGDVLLEMEDCDIAGRTVTSPPSTAVFSAADTGSTRAAVHAFNCRFHDIGANDAFCHGMYIFSGASVLVHGCRFENISGIGITLYGGSGQARYTKITDCVFAGQMGFGIGTRVLNGSLNPLTTTIAGCEFTDHVRYAIQVSGRALVSGCRFSASGTAIVGYGTHAQDLVVEGCTFEPGGYSLWCLAEQTPAAHWRITNSTFAGSAPQAIITTGAGAPSPAQNRIEIASCTFRGAWSEPSAGAAIFAAAPCMVRATESIFTGSAKYEIYAQSSAVVEIDRCEFGPSGDYAIRLDATSELRGQDNLFQGAPTIIRWDATASSSLINRRGIGPSIGAAATIGIDWNHDVFHVTGAPETTIQRIAIDDLAFGALRIHLVADVPFTLGQGATTVENIRTRAGTDTRIAANQAVALVFDPSRAVWYEV